MGVLKEKLTDREFRKRFHGKTITPIEEYKGSRTKTAFKCMSCNHEWSAMPCNIFSGSGCPKCAQLKKAENLKRNGRESISKSEAVDLLDKSNPSLRIIGAFYGSSLPAKFRCKVCSCDWESTSGPVIRGETGCPSCRRGKAFGRNIKITESKFENRISARPIELDGDYHGLNVETEFVCHYCDDQFYDTPTNIQMGRGCGKCVIFKAEFEFDDCVDGVVTMDFGADGFNSAKVKLDSSDAIKLTARNADIFAVWRHTEKSITTQSKLSKIKKAVKKSNNARQGKLVPMLWDYDLNRRIQLSELIFGSNELTFKDGDCLNFTRLNVETKGESE